MSNLAPGEEALFERAACALLLTTTDGLILRANRAACLWLGYDKDELVGKIRMRELLPVGARLFFHTHCQPLLEMQGSVGEIQVDIRNRQQDRLPMLINIVRERDGGEIVDHWSLFKASDRRAYERELLLARKAAEAAEAELKNLNAQLSAADRRKDEFLATLSHELRNPLAPMRSAVDVLKLKLGASGNDRLLQMFDRQLRHLTRLVDDLMEVSRITQGRMQLSRAPVELSALVRGVAQDLAGTVKTARHTLHLSVAEGPVIVHGDATRLAQVVVNLLTNACKYTPDGGRIELHLACHAGSAEIRVCDNGIGIPAPALATVFNMFSQLEPALERSKGGLGIGLALVRGIVALHGGSVRAESAGPGHGSTFIVSLPLSAEGLLPAETAPAHTAAVRLRALVVDDNEDAAETLGMALELQGCEVTIAHSGSQALDVIGTFGPALALLDIGLPDMTGYELARRLRQRPDGASVVLIATTGWGQQKDRALAFEAGFDHHLTKPIDFELLKPLLQKASAA